jgi:tetratricopeptide (TPR) repeat protein
MRYRAELVLGLVLAATTVAVYWPACHSDFVTFDDWDYVPSNPRVKMGLTPGGIGWAFTTSYMANWHPLTWLSYQLDATLFGVDPFAFHLTNVLLHAAATLLLFAWLRWATGSLWGSGLVAALFALHPLHVESVAWVAERKDVLSGFFWMLTLLAYTWYVRRPGWGRYAAVVASFAAGLMAKPMLVTLPCVLLLLDYWPLARVSAGLSPGRSDTGPGKSGAAQAALRGWRWAILEKLPLFALVAISCALTWHAQKQGGAVAPSGSFSFNVRVANALVAYLEYLEKMFWPVDLAVFYPHPGESISTARVAVAAAVLGAVTALTLLTRRSRPYFLVGWLWYLGTLVPVIGLVQVGRQAFADRYTYIPLVGVFIMIVWGGAAALRRARPAVGAASPEGGPQAPGSPSTRVGTVRRLGMAGAGLVALAACVIATRTQLTYWSDSLTLCRHAVDVAGPSVLMVGCMARALEADGQLEEAARLYWDGLRMDRTDPLAHNNLGYLLIQQGELERAIDHLREAIRLSPTFALAHMNLGVALDRQGDWQGAVRQFHEALRLQPDFSLAHANLAGVLRKHGRPEDAVQHCREALRLDPDSPLAHANLGAALQLQGQKQEAITHYRHALRLDAGCALAHLNLGVIAEQEGRADEALEHFREALAREPKLAKAHYNLGTLLGKLGQTAAAIEHLSKAAELAPTQASAHYNLGLALEEKGEQTRALTCFRKAVELQPRILRFRLALASALAKAGAAAEARQQFQESLKLHSGWPDQFGRSAWKLATHPDPRLRKGAEAAALAEQACQATDYQRPELLDALAAALAADARFDRAVAMAQKALQRALDLQQRELAAEIRQRLNLYSKREPFLDPSRR